MNRKDFMMRLEQLLMDIPQEERIEALAYYNGYFEDAGEENEEKIIKELESPEKVALIIRADVGGEDTKEYTETGYQDQRFKGRQEVGTKKQTDFKQEKEEPNQSKPPADNTAKIILIILATILTSPIWLGLGGAAIGVIVGGLGAVIGILFALVAVVIALYVTGVVLTGVGISMLASGAAAAGLGMSGSGLIILAIALLGTIVCIWMFGRFLPWLVKAIIHLCSGLFQRKGRAV